MLLSLLQRTLESGQAFSQRQLEQVQSNLFHAHDPFAQCLPQNRELVDIVRALQSEREALLGELSDALQVSRAHSSSAAQHLIPPPSADAND
jgi:hypothetical protein